MEYETVKQAAERMGVGVRTIQKWAKEGKFSGAKKSGRDWLIPTEDDVRLISEKYKSSSFLKLFVTGHCFSLGCCYDEIGKIENKDEKQIALAEYCYYRGDFETASEILEPYLYNNDDSLRCTSALIYVFSNLSCRHMHRTDYAVKIISEYSQMSDSDDVVNKALKVFLDSIITIQFHYDVRNIPPLEDYIKYLPEGLKLFACYLMAYRAYLEKDYSESLGIANVALAYGSEIYPLPMAYLHIISAVDLMNLLRVDEAKERIEKAWSFLGKDRFPVPFVEHHGMLHGLIEVFLRKKYPKEYNKIIEMVEGYNSGWYKYHNKQTGRKVADNLNTTEFTIAMLYNKGWRIKEIASHIEMSERTVKNRLQVVYEKLGINGKKELEQYMLK